MCDRNKLRPIVADLIVIVHELAEEAGRLADRTDPPAVAPRCGPRFAAVAAELQGLLAQLTEPAGGCRGRAARELQLSG